MPDDLYDDQDPTDDGSEDWGDDFSTYTGDDDSSTDVGDDSDNDTDHSDDTGADQSDADDDTSDDGSSDDTNLSAIPYPPGLLDGGSGPSDSSTPNDPWAIPQVGILHPDFSQQLQAYIDRMGRVQDYLGQIYPFTNGPVDTSMSPTDRILADPYYHDDSDYTGGGAYAGSSGGGPFQPGEIASGGTLIPDASGSGQPLGILNYHAGGVTAGATRAVRYFDPSNPQYVTSALLSDQGGDPSGDLADGADIGLGTDSDKADRPSAGGYTSDQYSDDQLDGGNGRSPELQDAAYRAGPTPFWSHQTPSADKTMAFAMAASGPDRMKYSEPSSYRGDPGGEYVLPWGNGGRGGAGLDKCNWFVADALKAGGFDPRDLRPEPLLHYQDVWTAHDYADPTKNIRGLQLYGHLPMNQLREGDIIAVPAGAHGGHVGFWHVDEHGVGGIVSANGPHGVRFAPGWPFVGSGGGEKTYIVRRIATDR